MSIALFAAVVWLREQLVKPTVAWMILNGMILFMTLSMTDYDFRQIVGKPDNVPIVSMLFIVAFFTWLYFKRAVDNDQRIAAGRPLFEQEDNDKVLVWPDLVYTEMICMVVVTAVLVVWGIVLQAPLEEPASSVRDAQPVEGAVVLPGFAGNARVLRPLDGRRRAAQHDSRGPDGLALHRLQQEGERLLHVQRAEVLDHDVHVRVSALVDRPDHSGDVPARPQLELLRDLRAVGRPQAGRAQQREPVGILLGLAGSAAAHGAGRFERADAGR